MGILRYGIRFGVCDVQPRQWGRADFLKLLKAAPPWHLYGSIPRRIPLEFHSDPRWTPGEIRGRETCGEGRRRHWRKGGALPVACPALVLLPPNH